MRYILAYDRRADKGGYEMLLVRGEHDRVHTVEREYLVPSSKALSTQQWIDVIKTCMIDTARDMANHIPIHKTGYKP